MTFGFGLPTYIRQARIDLLPIAPSLVFDSLAIDIAHLLHITEAGEEYLSAPAAAVDIVVLADLLHSWAMTVQPAHEALEYHHVAYLTLPPDDVKS
ncbi:MAG TPA: hypothetical protein VKB67_02040 [Rhizomicrobium sp.]|nr:hypothetical protein [Rhizomicrobium sp.]